VKIAHDAPPTIPQIFLHNTYTGKNRRFLLLYFRYLLESKDLERAKGFEPSTPTLAKCQIASAESTPEPATELYPSEYPCKYRM